MPEGTGLLEFAKKFPDRFFDVGIAEAHAVTFAAGLATQGMKPVVAVYSTFLQRAYDSIIHDVALQNLGVVFAIDRAGIVGQDGPTHHGSFDLGYLSIIPNLIVTAPSCLSDLETLLKEGIESDRPWSIRYPRGSGPEDLHAKPLGYVRFHQKVDHPDMIAIAVGSSAPRMIAAVSEVDPGAKRVTLVSVQCIKPIPNVLIDLLSQHPHSSVLCVEDGMIRGGFGSALLSELPVKNSKFESLGYRDHFVTHGSVSELEEIEGLSQAALVRKMREVLKSSPQKR
jgi:1-deoxy-D-xylulose-5-phosphate synthase